MNLGENIYRLRTGKNMSQGDLADALDVSRQSVSKWENNSATPELEKLIRMSELFHVTIDELVGTHKPQPEAQVTETAPQESSAAISQINTRKIVGILLIACGLVSIFVPGGLLSVFLFGVPLAVTGSVLAFAEADYFFRICWLILAVQFPAVCIFGFNFVRSDFAFTVIIILLFVLIAMFIWTFFKFTQNKLSAASKKIALISIALLIALSLLFYSLFQLSTPELSHIAEEAYIEEISE